MQGVWGGGTRCHLFVGEVCVTITKETARGRGGGDQLVQAGLRSSGSVGSMSFTAPGAMLLYRVYDILAAAN